MHVLGIFFHNLVSYPFSSDSYKFLINLKFSFLRLSLLYIIYLGPIQVGSVMYNVISAVIFKGKGFFM